MNPALVAPAGTVTVDGTVIALLLLARLTVRPSVPAAAFRVTVQESAPDPNKATLVQLNELKPVAPGAAPEPLRLITAELPVEELLVMFNCPEAAPAATGEKFTLKL